MIRMLNDVNSLTSPHSEIRLCKGSKKWCMWQALPPARAPCPLTRVKGSGVGQREGHQRHRDIKTCVSFMDKLKMGKVLRV